MEKIFSHFSQFGNNDCGPSCLYIISKFYSIPSARDKNFIRSLCPVQDKGVSLLKLCQAANRIGFKTLAVKISLRKLEKIVLPCIVLLNNNHYVVVYKITKSRVYVSDPAQGLVFYTKNEFVKKWYMDGKTRNGIAVILEPKILLKQKK